MPHLLLGAPIGGLVLVTTFVWLCLLTPCTSEWLVGIGERNYRDVVNDYTKMTRDRACGGSAIGLRSIRFLDSRAVLLMERMPSRIHGIPAMRQNENVMMYAIPIAGILMGTYRYTMGFVQAMACVMCAERDTMRVWSDTAQGGDHASN